MNGKISLLICSYFVSLSIVFSCDLSEKILKYPESCTSTDCTYILTWELASSKSRIDFSLNSVASEPFPWAAFGLNDKTSMLFLLIIYKPGGGVVDCISASDKFIIQASFNDRYHNLPLKNSQLGLIPELSSGVVYEGRIVCNFSHLVKVDGSDPEAWKVKRLDEPHYVQLVHGRSTADGVKKKHSKHPFVSKSKMNFVSPSDTQSIDRSQLVVIHGSLMTVVWLVLLSLATVASRYFKEEWIQGIIVFGKPIWFQTHRFSTALSSLLSVIAVLFVASLKEWTFRPNVHSILGLIVMSLMALNIFSGFVRPGVISPVRKYFRVIHGLLGHSVHLMGFVTMFFGLRQCDAFLPYWVSWVPVGFCVFRILMDVVLSILKYRYPTANHYEELVENGSETGGKESWSWRYTMTIVYLFVGLGASIVIIFALIFSPTFTN